MCGKHKTQANMRKINSSNTWGIIVVVNGKALWSNITKYIGKVGIYLPVDPVVGPYFSEHSFHPMGNEMITEGCHFSRILTIRLNGHVQILL